MMYFCTFVPIGCMLCLKAKTDQIILICFSSRLNSGVHASIHVLVDGGDVREGEGRVDGSEVGRMERGWEGGREE